MVNLKEILEAALALPPEGRATLADELLRSLGDAGCAQIDPAWIQEIEERSDAVERGEVELFEAAEVMRELRSDTKVRAQSVN